MSTPADEVMGGAVRELQLCGDCALDGTPLAVGGLLLVLLVILGVRGAQGASRDELAHLLWPERALDGVAPLLDPLLSRLRRLVGPVSGRGQIRLAGAGLDVDVTGALAALQAARGSGAPPERARLAAGAAATLENDLAPGCRHPWVDDAREGLREARADALELLAEAQLALATPERLVAGVGAARELVGLRPVAERPTALLMDLLERQGDVAAALAAYESLRQRLRSELSLVPGATLRARHTRLVSGGETEADQARPTDPVGRHALVDELDAALLPGSGVGVLFLEGPGGIGKTTVVRALLARAAARGEATWLIDARDGMRAETALRAAFAEGQAGVLCVDTYEQGLGLGGLVRAELGVGHPELAVVLAGRAAPEAAWESEGWEGRLRHVVVGPLDAPAARELVRGVGMTDPGLIEQVVGWSAGSPLALTVTTAAITAGRSPALAAPDADATLAAAVLSGGGASLLGADHEVLAVAAIARAVDARLLAAVLPGVHGDEAEAWLRGVPFSEPLGTRVALHERVREAVLARLKVTEPLQETTLRLQIADHLFARTLLGESWLLVDLAELIEDPAVRWGIAPPASFAYRVDRVRPGDAETIAARDGLASRRWRAGMLRYFERAPECVLIIRDAAGALAAYAVITSPALAPEWVHDEDPVLGAWLADAARSAPHGDVMVMRDSGYFDVPDGQPSPAVGFGNSRVIQRTRLTGRVMYTASDPARAGYAAQVAFLEQLGYERVRHLDTQDEDRELHVYRADWGPGGFARQVRDLVYREAAVPPPPPSDDAALFSTGVVRSALRAFHDEETLAASPLARGGTAEARVATARAVLREAARDAFGELPEDHLLRGTIQRGYLDPDGGHERAADELGLDTATYFRRLDEAAERIAAHAAKGLGPRR